MNITVLKQKMGDSSFSQGMLVGISVLPLSAS